ncbi:MAG: phosphoglycerate kinase [Armatimonadetes bacterium]|nr:phosphoglycerate kinase [Armatimonadota bacterium]
MAKKTIQDVDVTGKRVLVRVDFNVPQDENGNITDDTRIRAALPTIQYLVDHAARAILVSHLGRPKGVDEKLRVDPVAARLQELLGRPVRKASDVIGPAVAQQAAALKEGDVLLLENVRFYKEEEKNDPEFARQLASLADLYVNDAFGTAHRAHASTEGVAHLLPAVAGFLMGKEIEYLGRALANPERPFVAVLGGAKVADKIGVIENLLGKVDSLLIGGAMAFTFIKAQGGEIGKTLLDADSLDVARETLEKAKARGVQLILPTDALAADRIDASANTRVVPAGQIPDGWAAVDIGPEAARQFAAVVSGAKTVVWNGPMGIFEVPPFAEGTRVVARALAEANALTIVGGGDSVAAIEELGVADRISHVSTGGGASLEFLEGKVLPGIAALEEK